MTLNCINCGSSTIEMRECDKCGNLGCHKCLKKTKEGWLCLDCFKQKKETNNIFRMFD